jgi:hypothetical protein
VIDDESLVKTWTNTCLGYTSAVPSHSVTVHQFGFKDAGLKISFTGPSDKMSDDIEFGSDICPMTFSSVLTRK